MIQKIRSLIIKYWDIISYLFFGVCTTAVTFVVYIPCYNMLGMSATLSNIISWVVAVAFAYLTNKTFVFRSKDWSSQTLIPELLKFIGCRVGSGAAETLILLVAVDLLGWNGIFWKIMTQVMVVVLNYIGSKLLVFRKK